MRFSEPFVDLLFKIIDLPTLYQTQESAKVVATVMEKLILSARVWRESDFRVQVSLHLAV